MKYKVGDKVRIKSLDWYKINADVNGHVGLFVNSMSNYCGKTAVITDIINARYILDIDKGGVELD